MNQESRGRSGKSAERERTGTDQRSDTHQESQSSTAAAVGTTRAAALLAVPYDPTLPEQARQLWVDCEWRQLARLGGEALQHHPDRAQLAAYCAAAAQQIGERSAARTLVRHALEWGCSRDQLARLMLAGSRHTLARASFFARRERQSAAHFDRAFSAARLSSEMRRLTQAHTDKLTTQLKKARDGQALLRGAGAQAAVLGAPAWLAQLATRCLQAEDPHAQIGAALADNIKLSDDRVHFVLLIADGYLNIGDRMTALHFLSRAQIEATDPDCSPELRADLMRRLVALNAAGNAVEIALASALTDISTSTDQTTVSAMRAAFDKMREAASASQEHGHELLLSHLGSHWREKVTLSNGRRLTLIEIGTTREEVPGQGSTRKLAIFCKQHGMHFVTVDMDPHNSQMARDLFADMGVAFEAVTMKGEDYLRSREGPIDFIFLDAYDFDHGKHSDLRQSRYERYLGSRIDDEACHQMHLDCARSVAAKLWEHGLVCIDDTWRDGDGWAAKGTLAVPYLIENRYRLVDERNRAVLMAPGAQT